MKLLFLPLAVALAYQPSDSPSDDVLRLRGEGLRTLCEFGPLVQLGLCSPHFLECSEEAVALRKCPIRGEVFSEGACTKAGDECRDSSISILIEETQGLAEEEKFCANGGGAVYRTFNGCSRQAIVCSPNGRDVIAVACAKGQILQNDLTCQKGLPQCVDQPTTTIRDHFVNRLCNRPDEGEKSYGSVVQKREAEEGKCNTWYVACEPKPTIVRCEFGYIFDKSISRCRLWQQGDQCTMSGSCRGREYQSVPLGQCQSVYLYCDGLSGRYLHCSTGMVFNGATCVEAQSVGCPICATGETRPSSMCHQYYTCEEGKWSAKECPTGSAWNQDEGRCQQSYTCAAPKTCDYGTAVLLSCDKALFCTGNEFETFACPQNSRFDVKEKRCVYDPTCNPGRCQEGDTSVAQDCKSYRKCQNGKYTAYYCRNRRGQLSVACQICNSSSGSSVRQLTYPAQCQEGSVQAHQDDCSAYFLCHEGKWNYQRCPEGQSWNAGSCTTQQYGIGCSAAREAQCREKERVVNPSTADCRRLLECRGGRWMELMCPEGYYYDPKLKSCVPEGFPGQCASSEGPRVLPGRQVPQPPAPPPADSGYGVQCQGDVKIVDQFDCRRFWVCRNGQYANEVCPAGTGFNPRTSSCDSSVRCGAMCQEGTTVPLSICGEYKICYQGKFIDARCNLNKAFINGRCSETDCQPTNYYAECVDGSVQPPTSSSDKSVYRACAGGRWIERSCGPGMIFDWNQVTCVQETGPLPPPICFAGETQTAGGCTGHYEVCEYGHWVKKTCYYGEYFKNGYCRPGNCGHKNDVCVEAADAYRRDAVDCSKYYQCVHGKWLQRPCSAGTFFNERNLACDWPRNVPECGGVVGPY